MLSIEHRELRPGAVLITVKGKMMLGADTHQLDALVVGLLGEGYRRFVIDLEGLTHIDSTGIGRFIACYNKLMQTEDTELRMAAAAGAVRSAFRVTKLDTVFPFFETVSQAVGQAS